jgi:hypothetical protein
MLGRHIENGSSPIAYSGTQFTRAMLVALVPDSYIDPDPDAGVARLAGTVIGIVLLEPVLAALPCFHLETNGRKGRDTLISPWPGLTRPSIML